jgi:hypothetical protein
VPDPISTRPPRSQLDDRAAEPSEPRLPLESRSPPESRGLTTSEARISRPLESQPPAESRGTAVGKGALPASDPPPGKSRLPDVPVILGPGDGLRALARSIAARFTGSIAFEDDAGIRRVVFRDGDFVTASSSAEAESLVQFLAQRGDLAPDMTQKLARKLPPFGRHAGAALVAQGHLRQDELWTVLRAHAEWLLGRLASLSRGGASLEHEIPQRLQAEPGVFGGATGAEVLVETSRRVVAAGDAIQRLGGRDVRLAPGPARSLLAECALSDAEAALVAQADGVTLEDLLARATNDDFASVVWPLVELGVLSSEAGARRPAPEPVRKSTDWDPLARTPSGPESPRGSRWWKKATTLLCWAWRAMPPTTIFAERTRRSENPSTRRRCSRPPPSICRMT